MRRLKGRVAVVTGASSGIGAAIVHALAAEGMQVAGVDLNPPARYQLDISDRAAVQALPARVAADLGPAALLVNNAGVSLAGRFEDTSLDDLDWVMRTNFFGAAAMCHAFLPQLRACDEAHIVNVVSAFALAGFAGKSGYCSSKFALRGLSEALYAELHDSHVGVTLLYPGPVDTALVRTGRVVPASTSPLTAGETSATRPQPPVTPAPEAPASNAAARATPVSSSTDTAEASVPHAHTFDASGDREARAGVQRDAEAVFLARRAIPAERVARATVRAIRRRTLRVRLSPDYALIDWLTRLTPSLALRLFARASAKMPF